MDPRLNLNLTSQKECIEKLTLSDLTKKSELSYRMPLIVTRFHKQKVK